MAETRSEQAQYRRHRSAVPGARAKARTVAYCWDLPQIATSLEWVVTELVTNAIVHGRAARGSRVVVTYHLENDVLRVDVRDWASGSPHMAPSPASAGELPETGRGIQVVAALAVDWGVTLKVIGKSVWAELAVTSPGGDHP
ncbi:ATP-binding protein [Streptomyces sp. NPDC058459]|uniref:ATP-binding protein n=1 Tax=Streptomyces sp. NPDC058459 TaxID=3346508 RepID=UPI003657167E